jgi:hypothetical protein
VRKTTSAKESAMSNVGVVKALYDAFGRGDGAAVLAMFDAKIEWREAEGNPYEPSGKAWIGPDAILQNLLLKIGADWDGFTIHPKLLHDAGDTVVVEGRYTGTHKATGRRLDAQVCHVWRIRDGRVASFQQYVDTAQLQEVTGSR